MFGAIFYVYKKEVQKMENRNLSLKPINLQFVGTGSPVGNDPSEKAKGTGRYV